MPWRASSRCRNIIRTIASKNRLANLHLWPPLSPLSVSSSSYRTPPAKLPVNSRFTGKVPPSLLYNSLQMLRANADGVSNGKVLCENIQKLIQAFRPDQAIHVLLVAHQMGIILRHNQYEQIAYQLAVHKHWRYLQITTTMACKMTGSWSLRLLNWALRSYIEIKDFARLNTTLAEFDRHHITPTRRSYHLLIEGHLRNSDLNRARDSLMRMQASGFQMNQSTYAIVLNAYRYLGPNDTVEAQAFQALQGTGEPSDTAILNGLMKIRLVDGDVAGAFRVLKLITISRGGGLGDNGSDERGNEQLGATLATPSPLSVVPNSTTFNMLMMSLARQRGELRSVFSVFHQMMALGLRADSNTATALVVAYSTANMTDAALSLVYEMCRSNGISIDKNEFGLLGNLSDIDWTDLSGILAVNPTVDVFNALLQAVLKDQGLVGMQKLLRIMRQASILPDALTTQIIITHLDGVQHLHPRSLIRALDVLTAFPTCKSSITVQHLNAILNCLIRREMDIFRPSGWNAASQRVRFGHRPQFEATRLLRVSRKFDPTAGIPPASFPRRIGRPLKDVVDNLAERQVLSDRTTFALRIRREAMVKFDMEAARRIFDIMLARGIQPNAYHYAALIEGYAAQGNMREAKNVMFRAHHSGIKPSLIVYTILIKGFGRLGRPDLAKQIFTEMIEAGVKPDFTAVEAVVSAYWFVRAHKSARVLLLSLWPLVAPFPPELQDAPLRDLVQYFRNCGEKSKGSAIPTVSRGERHDRGVSVKYSVNQILSEIEQWQQIEEAVTWAKLDIGLEHLIHTDNSNRENTGDGDWS